MPVCGKGQTPNNKRETKTILNCFLPEWIWCVRAHIEKRHGYSRGDGLTFDARVSAEKGAKDKYLN